MLLLWLKFLLSPAVFQVLNQGLPNHPPICDQVQKTEDCSLNTSQPQYYLLFCWLFTYSFNILCMYGMADIRQESVFAQLTLKCSEFLVSRALFFTCEFTGNFLQWTGWSKLFKPYFRHLSSLLLLRLCRPHVFRAIS